MNTRRIAAVLAIALAAATNLAAAADGNFWSQGKSQFLEQQQVNRTLAQHGFDVYSPN